jgi:NADPH-dependent curcumin reductase CurA
LRLDRAVQPYKRRRGRPSSGHHARNFDQKRDSPGFINYEFADEHDPAFLKTFHRDASITHRDDVYEGIEKAPQAFIGLLRGENFGKVLVRFVDEA